MEDLGSVQNPNLAPSPHGLMSRVAVWLTIFYVLGGIALPIIYQIKHMRFHEGPPIFLYFVYFIIWSIPLHFLQHKAKNPRLQRTIATLVGDEHPVLFRDQPISLQRRSIRIEFAIASFFLVGGIVGAGLIHVIGDRGAGAPLPSYTLPALAGADPDKVPGYIRLDGTVARPALAVVQDYTIKNTRYRDYYMPRTAPNWTDASVVSVVELDNTFPDDTPDLEFAFNPPGPVEGQLEPVVLPQDIAAQFAQQGLKTATPVYLLTRKQLGGVVPGADIISECLIAAVGIVMALMFGGIGLFQKHSLDKRVIKFGQKEDRVGEDPDRFSLHTMATLGVPSRWLCYLLPYFALLELSKRILLALICWPALAINIVLIPLFPVEAVTFYLAMGVLADWLRGRKYRRGLDAWAPLQDGQQAYEARQTNKASFKRGKEGR